MFEYFAKLGFFFLNFKIFLVSIIPLPSKRKEKFGEGKVLNLWGILESL